MSTTTTSSPGVFLTPGRECAHAKSGCCPRCYDPMGLLRSTKEHRRKLHPPHYLSPRKKEANPNG